MKRTLPILLVLALIACALGAWLLWPTPQVRVVAAGPAPSPPPLPAAPAAVAQAAPTPAVTRVSGRVLFQGKPFPGATVRLRQGAAQAVESDGSGDFTLEAAPGEALLSASTERLASDVLGPLLLSAGELRSGLVLELFAAASVEGVVRDARTRQGVPGARVASTGGAVVSDAAGRFALTGLSYQQAWLEVAASGYLPRLEWLSLGSARAHAGLEVLLTPASTVTGRVARGGKPVQGAQVTAESALSTGAIYGPATSGADGRFSLQVSDGTLQLVAAAPGAARVEGPRPTLSPGAVEDIGTLELGAALDANGTVTLDGAPGAGVLLALVEARTQKVVGGAVADAAGRFTLQGVPVGSYLVQVRRGSLSVQAGPFAQTGEGTPWAVEVSLGDGLSGRVEPAAAGVRVWWRSGDWAGPAAETTTDATGGFHFEGVPRGQLMLEAEGPAGQGSARGAAGSPALIRLRRGLLQLSVSDGVGRPVTDYVANLRPLGAGMPRRFGVLSADGVLRLPLPSGSWAAQIEAPGYARPEPQAVEVADGQAELKVVLKAGVEVRGTVRDEASGLPVQGVTVLVQDFSQAARSTLATARSDARGEFLVRGAPVGAGLIARHPAYQVKGVPVPAQGGAVELRLKPLAAGAVSPPAVQEFEGVGMTLQVRAGAVWVASVFPGSPAEAAGLTAGDRIAAVDGAPAPPPLEGVVARITGPAGSVVRLTIGRGAEQFDVQLRRRAIQF